jgi:hypothetical protein
MHCSPTCSPNREFVAMSVLRVLVSASLLFIAAPLLAGPFTLIPYPATKGVAACAPGQVLVFSDFETSADGWAEGGFGDWERGAPVPGVFAGCDSAPRPEPAAAFRGSNVMGTRLDGCYANSGEESTLSRTFDFSLLQPPIDLDWADWHEVFVPFDVAQVLVNGDLMWEVNTPDASTEWKLESVDLSAYAGLPSVEIVFRLFATTVVNRTGWYLDDISISGCAQVDGPHLTLEKSLAIPPTLCSVETELLVQPLDEVNYCYVARNTGNTLLRYHALGDEGFGTVLSNLPHELEPGEMVLLVHTRQITSDLEGPATWLGSTAPGGYVAETIPINWQDISGVGNALSLTDDALSPALPLGFPFRFYGIEYPAIHVSSNGYLTVLPLPGSGCCTGQQIPSSNAPNGVIAGWWEDLNPAAGGSIHYQTIGLAPDRIFITQFTGVPHYPSGNPVTMQWKLFEQGNVIEVHYQSAPSDGGTHSAGLEDDTGAMGVQFFRGTAALATPLAVRYRPAILARALSNSTSVRIITSLFADGFESP